MASLADKAILSGAENRPPMLEKDMYESWRSRMEMYMLNRQHGRIILESVEHGPLLWPSVTEEGVTRLKKYSELSASKVIQADYDCKATNIILQALPLEIYALQHTSTYQSSPYTTSYQTPQFVLQGSSSSNLSISYPMNETLSTVNHNAYMASAPQIDYAPSAHHQSEFSSPETGLVVLVFQKGDDPIDAINHMMSFLTSVVTSRGGRIICRLVHRDRLHQDQKEHLEDCDELNSAKVALMENLSHYGSDNLAESNTESTSDSNIISYSKYMNESQYNTIQNSTLPAIQDDLILSVIEQLKTQVVNYTKLNQDNKQVNELLTAELERKRNQEILTGELALEKQ
nr:hypothetical protein [Tanacetum cinerariifolium]